MDTLVPTSFTSTSAATGVRRRPFTAEDLERMAREGIIGMTERVELIGGDIVAMAAKGAFHETVRNKLHKAWARRAPEDFNVYSETPLRLSPGDNPEPDIIVFPASIPLEDVRGDTVLLVVEVSDWSVGYDLGVKSRLYAHFGVREYWVIDAERLETHVHRDPRDGTYASVTTHKAAETLTPQALPFLSTCLTAMGFDWVDGP